jgi:Family of unknown function (DUF6328)
VTSPTILTRDDGRDETAAERLDRNTQELLNELRVAGTGIQVMFGFLLIVPFNTGWRHVSSFCRADYFVTLLCVATAAVLLLAPSIHHRILFRHGEKRYLVATANRFAIAAMGFLAAGFTGILILITDVVVGGVGPVLIGLLAAIGIAVLWFGIPLARLIADKGPDAAIHYPDDRAPHLGGGSATG